MKLLLAFTPAEVRLADELRRAKELFESGDTLEADTSVDDAIEHAEAELAPSSLAELAPTDHEGDEAA